MTPATRLSSAWRRRAFTGCLSGLTAALLSAGALAETVKIGVVQGLSGPPAITDFGESYLLGIELALKEYRAAAPKHTIEMIVYNDEANPQRAVSLVQRLISNDKVSAIVGTVNSGNVAAFAPMIQQAKLPLMAGPAIASDITLKFINESPSYIFRCSMVEKYQVDAMLDAPLQGGGNQRTQRGTRRNRRGNRSGGRWFRTVVP